ncbi:phospholipase D-like domain-containing protein DpdK [Micromonospora sp. NPDC005113]
MTTWRRSLRSSPRLGLSIHEVLATALTAELLSPSPQLWVVSPWISDIAVLDNRDQRLEPLLGEGWARELYLSETLGLLCARETRLTVVVRPEDHNERFLGRLNGALLRCGRTLENSVAVYRGADLHEKTICGSEWLITGSMNFTWRGLEQNDEAVTYSVDPALAAQTRIDLEHRWSA